MGKKTAYCILASHDGGEGMNFAFSPDLIKAENIELQHVICNELTIFINELGKHTSQETAHISFKGISGKTINW